MRQWIMLFVMMDAIVVAVVIWWVMNKRIRRLQIVKGPNQEQLAEFTRDVQPWIREYMATSYGGDPSTLPEVLPPLASRLEHQALAAGVELSREALESIVARALAGLDIARERDVQRSFEDARSSGARS